MIHSNGTVTATGKSTLIVPPEGCTWAPTDAFGPGAKGSNPEMKWGIPIEVPARYWVSVSVSNQQVPTPIVALG